MTQLRTTGLSKEAEVKLKRGEIINQLIIQDKNKPVAIEEQIIYLYALNRQVLDNLSINQIKQFRQEILLFVNKRYPDFCADVRAKPELDDELKVKLDECLKEYFKEIIR
jgi:F-type H+-transporting ATPase subunit alpha